MKIMSMIHCKFGRLQAIRAHFQSLVLESDTKTMEVIMFGSKQFQSNGPGQKYQDS